MNASQVNELLRLRYPAPEHAIFFEVANGVGAATRSYTDAVSMGLFPSRGLVFQGFEVKVSRNDWLRELKKPEKAEGMFGFMDYWWVVAGSPEIVKEGELPATWGLLVVDDEGRLVQRVKAPKLMSQAMTRSFVAALLRRACEMAVAPGDKALEEARQGGWEKGHYVGVKYAGQKGEKLLASVQAFEEASGLKLDRWSDWHSRELGEAVKKVMAGESGEALLEKAKRARAAAVRFVEDFDRSIATDPVAS